MHAAPLPDTPTITRIRARRKAAEQRSPWGRIGLLVALLAGLLLAAGSIWTAFAYASLTRGLPSVEILPALLEPPDGRYTQPTRLVDRSGEHTLLELRNPAGREASYLWYSLETAPAEAPDPHFLPANLISATLAAADPAFWSHPGFNIEDDLAGAGSSLAQQLASQLLLADEPASLQRSLRERILAVQITTRYGREKVLEWYLNSASFGRLTYGADAAARVYFDKPAASLSLAEAAFLAATSQAPELNPLDAPQSALERQNAVIQKMLRYRLISPEQGVQAAREKPALRDPDQSGRSFTLNDLQASISPAFSRMVIIQLLSQFSQSELERGGLRVITSLDYDLQTQAALRRLSPDVPA